MTPADIRTAYQAGNSKSEVLHMVVSAGREYPDAVWVVTRALQLDAEAVAEMEDNYLECK